MTTAFLMALLSNLVCAGGLALMAFFLTKIWRNPHLAHALWLLVLVKLLTPPLVEIHVPEFLLIAQEVNAEEQNRNVFLDLPAGQELSFSSEEAASTDLSALVHSTPGTDTRLRTDERQIFTFSWAQWSLAGWSLGTLIFLGVALRRHLRLLRVVAESQPADSTLFEDAKRIAEQMELAAYPQLRVTNVHVSPLVIGGWNKQVVLLPQRLLRKLSRDQARAVLAHELAHVRRSDHLVRLFEVLVLTLHWWNPLAWWASRQLQQAEEECCDAWVAWALPEHRRTYGQTLLQTVEFLTEQQVLPVATGTSFGRCFLERRIEMILNQTLPRKMSRTASAVALAAGVMVLPIAFTQVVSADPAPPTSNLKSQTEATNEKLGIISSKPVQDSASATADFPYAVPFKQGATRFEDGDDITIQEIRGTASTFVPGNIYRITGTYKLASHGKAKLYAGTTANNAADGRSRTLKVEQLHIDRGNGRFSLFLPMRYKGWPHVSFYPSDGGDGFGGNYFGTGDFVLEKWWRAKQKDQTARKVSDNSFVAPIETEFQKWRLQANNIVADASIDGTKVAEHVVSTLLGLREKIVGKRPRGNCSISGKVISAETGEPIDHARIYLHYSRTHGSIFVNTARDGTFVIQDIPQGPFSLMSSHTSGYQDVSYNPEGNEGSFPPFSLKKSEHRSGIVLKAEQACRVSGQILDANGEVPQDINTLDVMAWTEKENGKGFRSMRGRVNREDGSYLIDRLGSEPVYIMALNWRAAQKGDAYPPIYYPSTFSRRDAQRVTFDQEQNVGNIDITLEKEGGLILEGTVTDEAGRPVPEVFVVVHRRDMLFDFVTAYTNERGDYRIQGLGEGEFAVHLDAVHRGFVRTRTPVDLGGESRRTQRDFTLTQGVQISGKFVDEEGKDWQIGKSYGHSGIIDSLEDGESGFSRTSFWNKHRPTDVRHGGGPFSLGEGRYESSHMLFPTDSTFVIQGMMPGRTMIGFSPKKEGQKVMEILVEGQDVMESDFVTKPGQEIKNVKIVLGKR